MGFGRTSSKKSPYIVGCVSYPMSPKGRNGSTLKKEKTMKKLIISILILLGAILLAESPLIYLMVYYDTATINTILSNEIVQLAGGIWGGICLLIALCLAESYT